MERAERKLRLGLIGLGQAGAMILDEMKDFAGLPWTVTAAADPREHALRRFRAEFGGETYCDAAELCRRSEVDAVYIATPSWLHRQHAMAAADCGKHIIIEKPMALSIEDGAAIVASAKRNDVKLLAGHTHSFDAPIRKIRELVASGELGALRAINGWNFNEFNHRPRLHAELTATRGPILNQGPHHVDIVRQIGGGMLKSVRAMTIPDGVTGVEGGYVAYLEFDNRVPATLVYDGRSLFDTAELFWWIGEGGGARDPANAQRNRQDFLALADTRAAERDRILESRKEGGRYGGEGQPLGHNQRGARHHPFFGLLLVSCEDAAIRQSPDGLYLYGKDGRTEVAVDQAQGGRIAELSEMYEAITSGRDPFHDGAWGLATLEACFAILESAETRQEIRLKHQVSID